MSAPAGSVEERSEAALLETRNLTKNFGGLTAVDSVDLAVQSGEIRCLIGPNGAGKSTFLKLLVGEHSPSAGSIVYNGEDITDLESHERIQRGISMKFQVPAVYMNLSVRQNMRIAVQRQVERGVLAGRIDETLDRFNLLDDDGTKVENLSHGQQQWLEIGMATALDPDLLLLDEPTAGMSVEETAATADLVRHLNEEQGITLVVIEHDIDFVRDIAGDNTVTVLHQGAVFREGTIGEIEEDAEVRRIYLGEVN